MHTGNLGLLTATSRALVKWWSQLDLLALTSGGLLDPEVFGSLPGLGKMLAKVAQSGVRLRLQLRMADFLSLA